MGLAKPLQVTLAVKLLRVALAAQQVRVTLSPGVPVGLCQSQEDLQRYLAVESQCQSFLATESHCHRYLAEWGCQHKTVRSVGQSMGLLRS